MSRGDEMLAQYRAKIGSIGLPVSIRRYTGSGPSRPFTDYPTTGYVRNYDATELIGSIVQGDQVAIVLVDTLAAMLPVLNTDKLIVETRESSIKNVKKRRVGTTLIALEIQATG